MSRQVNNSGSIPITSEGVVIETTPGVPVSSGNPLPVAIVSGGVGGGSPSDQSANAPAIPNLGAGFASNHPYYPSWVLLKTIAANSNRLNVEVNNTSGGQIVLVRDDGTVGSGALSNASLIPLSAGAGVAAQGGSWSSTTFKGRIQVYGPSSGLFVSAYQE